MAPNNKPVNLMEQRKNPPTFKISCSIVFYMKYHLYYKAGVFKCVLVFFFLALFCLYGHMLWFYSNRHKLLFSDHSFSVGRRHKELVFSHKEKRQIKIWGVFTFIHCQNCRNRTWIEPVVMWSSSISSWTTFKKVDNRQQQIPICKTNSVNVNKQLIWAKK